MVTYSLALQPLLWERQEAGCKMVWGGVSSRFSLALAHTLAWDSSQSLASSLASEQVQPCPLTLPTLQLDFLPLCISDPTQN